MTEREKGEQPNTTGKRKKKNIRDKVALKRIASTFRALQTVDKNLLLTRDALPPTLQKSCDSVVKKLAELVKALGKLHQVALRHFDLANKANWSYKKKRHEASRPTQKELDSIEV
ncbi:MAG: hypothetical protein WCT04_06305 [Planctomycetota bacterium]